MYTDIDTITESETDLETGSTTESDTESNTESDTTTDSETESDDYNEYISDDDDDEIDAYNELMNLLYPVHMVSSHYYIGCYTAVPDDRYRWLLVNKIHKCTFMKFNGDQLSNYFFGYSGIRLPNKPRIDILQLFINPIGVYEVVVKTFWIRCIQRAWKRVYKKRQEYISYRKQITTIFQYQLNYKIIPLNTIEYPGLYGLLRHRH